MENQDHPSPYFNDGKMACFALRVILSLILGGGGGGVNFFFIVSKIVAKLDCVT